MTTITRLRTARCAALAAALGLLAAGCAEDSDFANEPPPPTPINVAVVIGDDELTVSPAEFGAGPVVLIVANQTQESMGVTLRGPEVQQSTGPISPRGTATLKVDLGQGEYRATTDDADLDPARVTVGPQRPSGQNELFRP